ncbi:MAG: ATP-binding cassette domain-containing protein [Chitinophagales bacterium]
MSSESLKTGAVPPVLELSGVTQVYGDRTVVKVNELALRPGELFCLVGPSGAGKSTLLRLAALLEQPASGEVRYGGQRVDARSPLALEARRHTATVFQRPAVFQGTVAENIAYGMRIRGVERGEARAMARREAERVGLGHLFDKPAATLSGGELQRMAVARALATKPEVLFLDEPTANLDPANVSLLEGVMAQARNDGTSVLLVTHNLGQARRLADRVGVLWAGELLESGPREELFTSAANVLVRDFLAGRVVY